MPDPQPRFEIPDAWAGKGRCPLCGASGLQVRHVSGAPDQMTCIRCRAAFEVEQDGARIRLTDVPLRLGWTFISTKPTTLNLPVGMYMGYVEFGASLSITQVSGPATVGNVVFAAISCE
jgi:hypothetical protein